MARPDLGDPPELVERLSDPDANVRMRAADALERLSRNEPALLDPLSDDLLAVGERTEQAEVRWNLARLLPRLSLSTAQRTEAAELLADWFADESSRMVRACALQAVVDLAESDGSLRAAAAEMLGEAMRSPVPSLAARARRILKPFEVDQATLTAALAREQTGLTLTILPDALAVARFAPDQGVPGWLDWTDDLVSVTCTGEELSILCRNALVPEGVTAERGWRAFKVMGPLDFSLFGILARIAVPLAQAKVSIFALSTYDTDYVLVREADLDRAAEVLSLTCTVVRG